MIFGDFILLASNFMNQKIKLINVYIAINDFKGWYKLDAFLIIELFVFQVYFFPFSSKETCPGQFL